jgi:hypothetical protein
MDAGIAESARRALYVLSHKERDRLEDTHCRYTPFRTSGEAKTYIAPTPAYEETLNNVMFEGSGTKETSLPST